MIFVVYKPESIFPLLFSLMLVQFICSISFMNQCLLSVWYLDDGTLIGTRSCLYELLSHFTESGPSFGLHINLAKSELYWRFGDRSFSNFHPTIKRINPKNSGLELLGSPIWGPLQFMNSFWLFNLIK